MSAEDATALPSNVYERDLNGWKDICKHTPLAGRTTDPEALALDKAVDMFRSGLRSCRAGDLEEGASLIAAAYLLDTRSYTLVYRLPAPEAKDYLLDFELLDQLTNGVIGGEGSPEAIVMYLFAANHFLEIASNGQEILTRSLEETQRLIERIQANPELEDEDTGPLHGCLNRARLHYRRSNLFTSLGNYAKAAKELSAALKIDPSLAGVRSERAELYKKRNLKDHQIIANELKRTIADAHRDSHFLRVDYLKLAFLVLANPKLGTFEEACSYRNESLRAGERYRELYGGSQQRDLQSIRTMESWYTNSHAKFASLLADDEFVTQRRFHDHISLDGVTLPSELGARQQHGCLKCGKFETNSGGKLFKCGRCGLVSYCSKECQTEDWKKHKAACKAASRTKSQQASAS